MMVNESVLRQTMPLSLVVPGESVEFIDMRVEGVLRQRLNEMGGRSTAHKITVRLAGER